MLNPSPGSCTAGWRSLSPPEGTPEPSTQREKPSPGKVMALRDGNSLPGIHTLWPRPGRRRLAGASMAVFSILEFGELRSQRTRVSREIKRHGGGTSPENRGAAIMQAPALVVGLWVFALRQQPSGAAAADGFAASELDRRLAQDSSRAASHWLSAGSHGWRDRELHPRRALSPRRRSWPDRGTRRGNVPLRAGDQPDGCRGKSRFVV